MNSSTLSDINPITSLGPAIGHKAIDLEETETILNSNNILSNLGLQSISISSDLPTLVELEVNTSGSVSKSKTNNTLESQSFLSSASMSIFSRQSKKPNYSVPILKYFCIFTNKLGQNEENRHEQILYYGTPNDFLNPENIEIIKQDSRISENTSSPSISNLGLSFTEPEIQESPSQNSLVNENRPSIINKRCTPVDTQVRQVGLAQAIINFTKTFSQQTCENVHSKKARVVFLEPEPGYFIILNVALGFKVSSKNNNSVSTSEYLDQELSDLALQGVIKQAYIRFRIGHGTLDSNLHAFGHKKLQLLLTCFYDGFLSTVLDLSKLDIFSGMSGLPILPVSKATFLQVQSTLKQIQLSFPNLEAAALLHDSRLVWSGAQLPEEIISFLTDLSRANSTPDYIFPKTANPMFSSFFSSLNPFSYNSGSSDGNSKSNEFRPHFLNNWDPTSPFWGRSASDPMSSFRVVYLGENTLHKSYCSIFECWPKGYLVLFFSIETKLDTLFISELETYLNRHAFSDLKNNVISDLEFGNKCKSGIDSHYSYIYFNGMNLALHSRLESIPSEVHILLLDLQKQASYRQSPFELLLRTAASSKQALWVGVRVTLDNTLYFVIQRDASLTDIEEDISYIANEYFTNLFLN